MGSEQSCRRLCQYIPLPPNGFPYFADAIIVEDFRTILNRFSPAAGTTHLQLLMTDVCPTNKGIPRDLLNFAVSWNPFFVF